MKSIYSYLDYREFLKDFYNKQKKLHSYFSYRYICNKIEMNISYVVRIFNGHIHISTRKIKDICTLCKLNTNESLYFENLVHYAKAKTNNNKKIFKDKLDDLRQLNKNYVPGKKLYLKWYYKPIYAILLFEPFNHDYKALASMIIPPISEDEAKEGIQVLHAHGIIKKNEDNKFIAPPLVLDGGETLDEKVRDKTIRDQLQSMLDSWDLCKSNERVLSSTSFYLSESKIVLIKELFDQFSDKVIKMLIENDEISDDTRAYHLQCSLVPQSQKKGKGFN